MYELFSEKEPFENANLNSIKNKIIKENIRPKINEKIIPQEISVLIRYCWQNDENRRPKFKEIVQ